MTVQSTLARVSYTIAGAGLYTIPYYFLANGDLIVIRTPADGSAAVYLADGVDYTVTGAGDEDGGTLTLAAPVNGDSLTIINEPEITQLTQYPETGKFPAASHERALDKLTMVVSRLRDLINRAFVLSDSDVSAPSLLIPSPVAGRVLKWNDTGNGLRNSDNDPDALIALATAQADASAASAAASATSAAASATYATASGLSQDAAAASAVAAAASLDSFDDRYLGAKAVAPTLDNDGNALVTGALYWNTTNNKMWVWSGAAWAMTVPDNLYVTVTQVTLNAWTVEEVAGVLYFKVSGVAKAKLDGSGNLTCVGNVTGYGTM